MCLDQMPRNFEYFIQYMILKILNLPLFCLPAIRPGSASAIAPVFPHNKGNRASFYKTVIPKKVYPMHHGLFFNSSILSFLFLSLIKGKKLVIMKGCHGF